MSAPTENMEALLHNTKLIAKHQEEIKNLRGESFNIFSILKMEFRENDTHSAFLGELLNPQGSHLFKTVFLEHFLKSIDYQGGLEIKSAKLILEKHVGTRDDKIKSGGRIDIYISDAKGNSICIENKIYANDQFAQIERYANHNTNGNKVYYLTLEGGDASMESRGNLKEGQDYFCISYKKNIVDWLEQCLKEAVEQPILRESIKQYILLIKKLTNQLTDNKMDQEIQELILKNYNSAKLIEANVWKAELAATYPFLNEIKVQIERVLLKGWTVIVDEDLNQSWTGLGIEHNSWKGIQVRLEGQSKMTWHTSIYGVAAHEDSWDRIDIKNKLANVLILKHDFKESHAWPFYKYILRFNETEERAKLFDEKERSVLVNEIANLLIELAKECEVPLSDIKRINSL